MLVLLLLQVMVFQLFALDAVCGVQVATGTFVVLLLPQVMVTQLLPEAAVCAVQLATGTFVVVIGAGQVVVV